MSYTGYAIAYDEHSELYLAERFSGSNKAATLLKLSRQVPLEERRLKELELSELERKRKAKQKAVEVEKLEACLADEECLAEKRRKEDENKQRREQQQQESISVCKSFYKDLSDKTNFSYRKVVLAKPMITGAYICVAQGVVETPNGKQFKQVELTGNPSTGAYTYK